METNPELVTVVKLVGLRLFEKDDRLRSGAEDGRAMGGAARIRVLSCDRTAMQDRAMIFIFDQMAKYSSKMRWEQSQEWLDTVSEHRIVLYSHIKSFTGRLNAYVACVSAREMSVGFDSSFARHHKRPI